MGTLRSLSDARQVLLSAEHIIGRMVSCRLCLPGSAISLAHALIRWNGESWELRDLGSTNGTFVGEVRATPGEVVELRRGSVITFGDEHERWELLADAEPLPAAVPLDGGEPRFWDAGAVVVPSASDPLATIFLDGDQWMIEVDEARRPIAPETQFSVAGRKWRFECPSVKTATLATEEHPGIDGVTLVFDVSRDEEHVVLSMQSARSSKRLGERTCFYLALLLARQRLEDGELSVAEQGWLDVERLLSMVPEYGSPSAINVEVHRLRRVLAEAGVTDAPRIIERRRGQVRLGTTNFVFRAGDDQRTQAEHT